MIDDIAYWSMILAILAVPYLWFGRVCIRKVAEWNGTYVDPSLGAQLIMPILFPLLLVIKLIKTLWRMV